MFKDTVSGKGVHIMDDFTTLDRKNTGAAKWDMARKRLGRDDVLVFSVADSDYETPKEVKAALQRRVRHGAYGYTLAGEAYHDAVMDFMERRYGLATERDWILPAPKVLTALALIIRAVTDKGAKILIQSPVYNNFPPLAEASDRTLVKSSLKREDGRFVMDYADLEKKFAAGVEVMVLCSPHNPVGRVWTRAELERLIELCKQYDVYLLSDEIHADIIMEGHTFISAGEFFADHDRLAVVTAPSKTFNIAGLHSANIIIKDESLREKTKKTMRGLFIGSPNLLAMEALKAAYTECDYWVDHQNAHVKENYERLVSAFRHWHEDVFVASLEGTYLAWVDVSVFGLTGKQAAERLAEEGVVVADGGVYGEEGRDYLRINLACSKEQLEEGLARMEKVFGDI